jgi:hypothetical protein
VVLRNRVLYARIDAASEREEEQCPNGDLLPVLAVVWMGSVVRVAAAVGGRETFGGEATLALITAVIISFMFIQGAWWFIQRAGRPAPPPAKEDRVLSDASANVISLAPRLAARRSSSSQPET